MAAKPRTLNVEFQGFPCSPIFEMRRSPGLDSDFSFVHIARQDLGTITIQDPPGGFAKAVATLADLSAPSGKGRLNTIGDVLVEDLEEDGITGVTLRFRHMVLDEGSIEAVAATDGGGTDGLVRVGLRDMRALWNQGMVMAWVNVVGQVNTPQGLAAASTTDHYPYVPGSSDRGAAWTIRRVLEVLILPNLPGKPSLDVLSPSLEGRISGPHKWDGVPTKQAFQDVLADVDAVCVLNLDASVSVWVRGDGPLQDVDNKLIPDGDPRIASKTTLLSYRCTVPDTVVVLGRPIVDTVQETLVACGEVTVPGFPPQLLPISQVFAQTNAPSGVNSKTIILEHDKRRSSGLVDDLSLAFERWAYRWFALPSFVNGLKTQVPIENCAETDGDGQRLPPIVRAQGIRTARVALAEVGTGALLPSGTLRPSVNLSSFSPDSNIIVYNLPLALQNDGAYALDMRRGLVKFDAPRLQVVEEGTAIDSATIRPATVTMTFGVSRKPPPDGPLRITDRYASAWQFNGAHPPASETLKTVGSSLGGGSVKSVSVKELDMSTALVLETDLQQLNALGGKSNRSALDGIAQKIAEPLILANRFVPGAVVTFVGIESVIPTGRVLSVIWKSADGVPTTEAHDGQPAPLRAAPRAVTLQDIRRGLGRVGVESVGTTVLGYLPGSRS